VEASAPVPFDLLVNDRDRDESCKSISLSGAGPDSASHLGKLILEVP